MKSAVSADRLVEALIGAACADALGAGYEFGGPMPSDEPVTMRGQGAFLPGEWTDNTSQLLAIAMAAANGLRSLGMAACRPSVVPTWKGDG